MEVVGSRSGGGVGFDSSSDFAKSSKGLSVSSSTSFLDSRLLDNSTSSSPASSSASLVSFSRDSSTSSTSESLICDAHNG